MGGDKAELWFDLREKEQALRRWAGRCDARQRARHVAEVGLFRSVGGWILVDFWSSTEKNERTYQLLRRRD